MTIEKQMSIDVNEDNVLSNRRALRLEQKIPVGKVIGNKLDV